MAKRGRPPGSGKKIASTKKAPKPAGKPKPAAKETKRKETPAADSAKADTVARPNLVQRQFISQNELQKLLRSCASMKQQTDSLVGDLREKIGNAVEKHHLNKGVFAWIRKLDKMEPEKLALFMDDFDHYFDISGLYDRAKSVERLALGDENGPPAKDDGEVDQPETVAKPKGNGSAPVPDGEVSEPHFGQATGAVMTELEERRRAKTAH